MMVPFTLVLQNRKPGCDNARLTNRQERQLQMHVEELKTRNAHLQEQLRATAADLHNLRKALGCLGPTQSRSMLPVSSAFAMHLPPPHAFATCANVAPTTWSASDSEATLASSSLSSVHNSPPPSDSQLLSMLLEAAVLNALQCPSAAVPTLLPHQRL